VPAQTSASDVIDHDQEYKDTVEHPNYDWSASSHKYREELGPNWAAILRSWLTDKWKEAQDDDRPPQVPPLPHVEIKLSVEQAMGVELVRQHEKNPDSLPCTVFLVGRAGTGKSLFLKLIANEIVPPGAILLTAMTGTAADPLFGSTTHSALSLPIARRSEKPLRGQKLMRLQKKFRNIRWLVIDEFSMNSTRTFYWIDQRLRQIKGVPDLFFGGLHVIFGGDIAQFQPILAAWLCFQCPQGPYDDRDFEGYLAYRSIRFCILLRELFRCQEPAFQRLLWNLRVAQPTREDHQFFQSRNPSYHQDDDFKDATYLNYYRRPVKLRNLKRLRELTDHPTAKIKALSDPPSASSADDKHFQSLLDLLLVKVGASVMLGSNVWTEAGLVNGASGIIEDILYEDGQSPPELPVAIMVKFTNFRGERFVDFTDAIPICPRTVVDHEHGPEKSRTQIPLILAWAITLYKSQGKSIEKVHLDIGTKEGSDNATYVGTSRVIDPLMFVCEPFEFSRLLKLKKAKNLKSRLHEELRFFHLALETGRKFPGPWPGWMWLEETDSKLKTLWIISSDRNTLKRIKDTEKNPDRVPYDLKFFLTPSNFDEEL
jgi:hypothetical protein